MSSNELSATYHLPTFADIAAGGFVDPIRGDRVA
jgi:hypothetical protein